MSLKSNALITVDEYALLVAQPYKSQPEKLRQIEVVINAASDYIEGYCERTFLSGSMETDTFTGKGSSYIYNVVHASQMLSQAPITTLAAPPVLFKEASTGTWTEISNTLFTYNATTGELYFHALNGIYFLNDRRYKVEYYYGYNGVANIPYDLKQACAALAKFYMQSMNHMGVTSTEGRTSRSYNLDRIPSHILRTLNRYIK